MKKIGLCVTGSFCTFSNLLTAVDALVDAGYEIVPVFSYNVSTLDTRFFKQADFEKYIVEKTGKTPIKNDSRSRNHHEIRHRAYARCSLHGQYACENRQRHHRYADYDGSKSNPAHKQARRAVYLVKRRTGRKRSKRRNCAQHQKLISRTFRSRRAEQQTALFDCGRLSHFANDRKSVKPRANSTGNTLICRTIAVSIKNNGFRIVKSVVFCCKIDKIATFV